MYRLDWIYMLRMPLGLARRLDSALNSGLIFRCRNGNSFIRIFIMQIWNERYHVSFLLISKTYTRLVLTTCLTPLLLVNDYFSSTSAIRKLEARSSSKSMMKRSFVRSTRSVWPRRWRPTRLEMNGRGKCCFCWHVNLWPMERSRIYSSSHRCRHGRPSLFEMHVAISS